MEVKLFAPWRFVFSLQLLRFGAVSGVKFDFISESQISSLLPIENFPFYHLLFSDFVDSIVVWSCGC